MQTIHAFCTRLLHQFPFEANVAARFEVLDEATRSATARAGQRSACCSRPRATPDSALGRALATAIASAADQTFQARSSREAIRKRDEVHGLDRRTAAASRRAIAELCGALGVDAGRHDRARRGRRSSTGRCSPCSRMAAAVAASAQQGSKNDQEQAATARRRRAGERRGARRRLSASLLHRPSSSRARASSPGRSQRSIRRWPSASARSRRACCALLERRTPSTCRDRTARAAHHRGRGDRALPRREGPPRPARLRRPDRQDAGAARPRSRGLGALQARSRHRPCADRRGAGHQPEAMGDHPRADRGVHRRRRRARPSSARSSRSATRSSRSSRSRARRRASSTRCGGISTALCQAVEHGSALRAVQPLVPLGPNVLGAVDTVFDGRGRLRERHRRQGRHPAHEALPRRGARAGRDLAADRARRASARSKAGTRRSTT